MPEPDDPNRRLDELEDAWVPERPTKERLKKIERTGPEESYPPPSTATLVRSIQAWMKANWWIVAVAGATGGTAGLSRLPWGDWLGLATKAELAAERGEREKLARVTKRQVADLDAGVAAAKDKAGQAFDLCQTAQSQAVGASELAESVKPKKRR